VARNSPIASARNEIPNVPGGQDGIGKEWGASGATGRTHEALETYSRGRREHWSELLVPLLEMGRGLRTGPRDDGTREHMDNGVVHVARERCRPLAGACEHEWRGAVRRPSVGHLPPHFFARGSTQERDERRVRPIALANLAKGQETKASEPGVPHYGDETEERARLVFPHQPGHSGDLGTFHTTTLSDGARGLAETRGARV
jgi:hypothetical protein